MKNNKIIKIKGQKYTLKIVDELDNDCCGHSDCDEKIIYIKKSKNDKLMISTLVHELYHCYFFECGLPEYAIDETLIYWLEKHFFDIDIEVFDFIEDMRL